MRWIRGLEEARIRNDDQSVCRSHIFVSHEPTNKCAAMSDRQCDARRPMSHNCRRTSSDSASPSGGLTDTYRFASLSPTCHALRCRSVIKARPICERQLSSERRSFRDELEEMRLPEELIRNGVKLETGAKGQSALDVRRQIQSLSADVAVAKAYLRDGPASHPHVDAPWESRRSSLRRYVRRRCYPARPVQSHPQETAAGARCARIPRVDVRCTAAQSREAGSG